MTRNTQIPYIPAAATLLANYTASATMPTRLRSAGLLASLLLALPCALRANAAAVKSPIPQAAHVVPNHIVLPSADDAGGADKINGRLERAIAKQDFTTLPQGLIRPHSALAAIKGLSKSNVAILDAFVCFDHPPTASDTAALAERGFTVKNVYSHVIYAVHVVGQLSAGVQTLRELTKNVPGITTIQPNQSFRMMAIQNTRQIGARQAWTAFEPHNGSLPLQGDPQRAIAIMDTGIDGTHPDLTGGTNGHKIVAFDDAVSGGTTPVDYVGHGSFVAGVAAGTGQSGGIATGTGYLPLTLTGDYYVTEDLTSGLFINANIPVDTTGFTSSATVTASGYAPTFYPGDVISFGISTAAQIADGTTIGTTLGSSPAGSTGGNSPLTATASMLPGTVEDVYGTVTVTNPNDTNTVSIAVTTPYTAIGDGFNLMAGVAPASELVSVRVGDNTESISEDAVVAGYEYISQNMQRYNIGVLNMSYGSDDHDTTQEVVENTAVNALVAQGIVCVAAAGNSRLEEAGIGSPASAANCIAVAAVGNANQITDYSSYGTSDELKPDVAAPGGSYPAGDTPAVTDIPAHDEAITSVDSNFNESGIYNTINDVQSNDYTDEEGTSFSSPHVAGSAALLEQALTLPGAYGGQVLSGGDEALSIKALLEMTSTETNTTADAEPSPTLERQLGRDVSEGYGKINTDAAISAVLTSILPGGTSVTGTLGTSSASAQAIAIAPQAYAANVTLTAGKTYTFYLNGVTGANGDAAGTDYNLYLYHSGYSRGTAADSTTLAPATGPGDPLLITWSVSPGTVTQATGPYTPTANEVDVLVVKRVAGYGPFTLSSVGYTARSLATTVTDASTGAEIVGSEVVATDSTSGIQYNQAPTATTTTTTGTGSSATSTTATTATFSVPSASALTLNATAFGYYQGSATTAAGATTASIALTPSHTFSTLGLQMISVPMGYSGQSIAQITLPQLDTAAVWSPTFGSYEISPLAPANTFTPGQAYWVRFQQPTSLNLQGTTPSAGSYPVQLQVGWNMVGSPYANPSSLESATVTLSTGTTESFADANTANVVGPLYSYNSATNAYETLDATSALTAYTGYWVHANQACSLNIAGS